MACLRCLFAAVALAAAALWPPLARATDVLVVQSGRSAAYEEAVGGFRSGFGGTVRTVVMSDYAEVDVERLTREERPRLVLAVGDPALAAGRKVRNVPVLALLALELKPARHGSASVGGVAVLPPPERYLELFRSLGIRRVGVVHDPARTGPYVRRARRAARTFGVDLEVREVDRSREVPGRLDGMAGAVEALWMLPDATAVTAGTLDGWFLFSLREKVPVVTFSEQYLEKGAAFSIDADRADMGRQAAEMAESLLSGAPERPSTVDARRTALHANPAVARSLGLSLPDDAK
jgi:ABC-type uncharacterized transport system substrate-binding protein